MLAPASNLSAEIQPPISAFSLQDLLEARSGPLGTNPHLDVGSTRHLFLAVGYVKCGKAQKRHAVYTTHMETGNQRTPSVAFMLAAW